MAVNLVAPAADSLLPIDGVDLGWAEAGVRKANHRDVLLVRITEGSTVTGVFTQSHFCAAPVQVCREHLTSGKGTRVIAVNTSNANADTGAPGLTRARQTCDTVAKLLGVSPEQVLSFSTGVILEPLPVDRITTGLPAAKANTRPDNQLVATEAIMTTDTVPKATSATCMLSGKTMRMSGISKGADMIRPNMATMPDFIATGADMDDAVLQGLVRHAADHSFNSMTVDDDTSTSDSFVIIATGRADTPHIDSESHPDYTALRDALMSLAQELAQEIVRDDESAMGFMIIQVKGGRNIEECRLVAYATAHSPLVEAASYTSDPNLGRILTAVGYAGMTDLDANGVNLWFNDVWVARDGGRSPDYREKGGQRVMKQAEITMHITLGRGNASVIVWTCDLLHGYVPIDADYRS